MRINWLEVKRCAITCAYVWSNVFILFYVPMAIAGTLFLAQALVWALAYAFWPEA